MLSGEARLRRVALESQGERVEEIVALFVQGREIGTDGAEGFETCRSTEAAGDFLFDFGHAHRLLRNVIGKGDTVIGHETQDIIGMLAQPVDEVERLALFGSTALAGRRRARVVRFPAGEHSGVGGSVVRDALFRQRPAGRSNFVAGLDQQVDHAPGPGLAQLLEDVGQLAQVVGVAQAVRATQIAVRLPAVVDQRAGEHGQDTEGIEGFFTPVRVAAEPGQRGGRHGVQPVGRACHAHPGLVGVGDGGGFERLADGGHRRRQTHGSFLIDRQHGGIRYRQAEQVAQQLAGARHRHHMLVGQMHHGGLDARPVLHRRRDIVGKFAPMHLAASATRFENPVLGDFVAQGRDIEHLAGLDHNRVGQRASAGGAVDRRDMGFDMIWLRDLLQGVAGVAWLSARGLLSRLAQRLGLGFVRPVRGGRFAGVAAVLRQAAFEFGNLGGQRCYLSCQRRHLGEQRADQVVLLGVAQQVKVGQGFHGHCHRQQRRFLYAALSRE